MKMLGLLILAAMVAVPAAAAPIIRDTSYRDADGHRVQQLELIVNAPLAKVWRAFTTDAGFTGWAAPVAHVVAGNGGMIESSYSLTAKIGDAENIRNRIVLYLPQSLLVLQNEHAPKNSPFKAGVIDKIRTVIRFEDLGHGRTKVVESGVGYGDGPEFDSMYALFHAGNAAEFTALARYLERGPVDWTVQAGAAEAAVSRPASHPGDH